MKKVEVGQVWLFEGLLVPADEGEWVVTGFKGTIIAFVRQERTGLEGWMLLASDGMPNVCWTFVR